MKPRKSPLKDRIVANFRNRMGYEELMQAVFPPSENPGAYNSAYHGGPPGCAIAFGRALRELGIQRHEGMLFGKPEAQQQELFDERERI